MAEEDGPRRETKRKKPRPRWLRWLVRAAIVLFVVPIVLVLLVVGLLHTDAGKARVRSAVVSRLGARVNGTVEIGTLDYALFGDLALGDVVVKDETGREAVRVRRLRVAPSWGELLGGGAIALDAVELDGLHVHLIKDASGGSNLASLLKPSAEEPAPVKEPSKRALVVRSIRIADVDVEIDQPDGTRLAIEDAAVEGSARVVRADKTYDVDLSRIALSFGLQKPAAGLEIGLRNVETGLSVDVAGGKGTAKLAPLSADLSLKAAARGIDRGFPVRLEGITIDIGDGKAGLDLDGLTAGALALATVEVHAPLDGTKLSGVPDGDVVGLRIVAKELNALLGKEVLLEDVGVELHLAQKSERHELAAHVSTAGGTLDVKADVRGPVSDAPELDVDVKARALDTQKILGAGVTVPPIKLAELDVHATGKGKDVASLRGTATVRAKGAKVRNVDIDGLDARASLEGGRVAIQGLEVDALGQRLVAKGDYVPGSKNVDVEIVLYGEVDEALARLAKAGVEIKTKLPKGSVRLAKDDLRVRIKGEIEGDLTVTAKAERLAALGATVRLDAKAEIRRGNVLFGQKPISIQNLDAKLDLVGLRLSTILALRGKKLPDGFDAVFDLHARASGNLEEPKARVDIDGKTLRKEGLPRAAFHLGANVTGRAARVQLRAHDLRSAEDRLLSASADLPLSLEGDKKGLDPYGRLEIDLELPRRSLGSLAGYAPLERDNPLSPVAALAPLLEEGKTAIAAKVDVGGSVARPQGKATVDLEIDKVGGDPGKHAAHAELRIDPAASGGTRADAGIRIDLEGAPAAAKIDATADFPTSPLLGGAARMGYEAHVVVASLPLEKLPKLEKLERVRALGGALAARVDAKGNRQDITLAAKVDLTGIKPKDKGPLDLGLGVDLGPAETKVAATVDAGGAPLVVVDGTAGLGGRGLFAAIPRLKEGAIDPSLAAEVTLPMRPLTSLASLSPALADKPGDLDGKIVVSGSVRRPLLQGSLGVDGVEMADGSRGGVGVALAASAERVGATIGLGSRDVAAAPIVVEARAEREDIGPLRDAISPLAVDATIRSGSVPVPRLVPAFVAKEHKEAFAGTVEWNMTGRVELEKGAEGVRARNVLLDGGLHVKDASFRIPKTKRVLDQVNLTLAAEPGKLRLVDVRAHEDDCAVAKRCQNRDRWLRIDGEVALSGLRPTDADLHVRADKWLVFGPRIIGLPDAPRGTVDLDATARVELDRPVRVATVHIDKLIADFPDRFDKAHQPEDVHVGDVLFVGDEGVVVGKLPVPESVKRLAEARKRPPAPAPAGPIATASVETGLDAEITIAKGAKLTLFAVRPLELEPYGTISLTSRPGGRQIRGRLDMAGGKLSLGGAMHPLARGTLTFDDRYPTGWLDLWFEKPMDPWALRNISEASGGRAIEIHMFGPLSDSKTVLAGSGSPGALADLLSMHNQGRERYVSQPDLPGGATVQFPQYQGLLTLSFLSVNLPHLLFLDRVEAYADPYEGHRAYGKIEDFAADAYFAGGQGRFRASKQPRGAGKSEAEVEALYLFVNDPRVLFGIGGTAGSRGGGGPAVVFEWSSEK